jgi:hypothetical protein
MRCEVQRVRCKRYLDPHLHVTHHTLTLVAHGDPF